MRERLPQVNQALYLFHKALNRPFSGSEDLMVHALGLIIRQLPVDRLCAFSCAGGERTLRLEFCLDRGRWIEVDEEIHLDDAAPLWRLAEGERRHLAFASPHPVLYVPLRWEGSRPGAGAVLRLERLSGHPFTPREREFASLLAEELAQNLHQALTDEQSGERLARLKAMNEVSAVFAGSMRVEDGLRVILQGVARLFGFDRVRLYLVDRQTRVLRGELSVDVRGRVLTLREEEVPLASEHRLVRALNGDGGDALMEQHEDRILGLPLVVQGQKTGLLIADNLLSQQPIGAVDAALLGSFAGQIALAVDNARLFEEVQALSLHDSLTGLPVRRFFDQRLQEELYRAERFGHGLSLAIMDVDHFKPVNDTYGHQIGDAVLQAVGGVILRNLRKLDFPARYGGDEILVLLPQTKEEDAMAIMSRLLEQIRRLRIPVEFSKTGSLAVTASIGIACYPDDGRTPEELLRRADEALYWVKSKGRDGLTSRRRVEAAQGA